MVITGIGMLSPVGLDTASSWRALLAGQSGVAPITGFDSQRIETRIACEMKGFYPETVMERKEAAASDKVRIGELCHASVLERRGWRYGSRRRSGRVSPTEETWHGDAKMIGHGRETPEWEEGE